MQRREFLFILFILFTILQVVQALFTTVVMHAPLRGCRGAIAQLFSLQLSFVISPLDGNELNYVLLTFNYLLSPARCWLSLKL